MKTFLQPFSPFCCSSKAVVSYWQKDVHRVLVNPLGLRLLRKSVDRLNGPRQANLVLIAYASSEGSGEPAHPRSLARTSAARSYKQ